GGGLGGDGGSTTGDTMPSVRIVSPASGQTVPANRFVDITVETDSTTTSFLLKVNDRVASSKALPPDMVGPVQAILSWKPEREGAYNLEVIAFNEDNASAPAALALTVSGTAVEGPSGATGVCTGRVLVSQLNFRDAPSTSAVRQGQFDVGETVTITGRNPDTSWYYIQRTNGQQAWVINNAQWMQVEGACDNLPVSS
ncbi:MAG: SH3 domain-containing protein, partial [Anaerolineae bacterium]|nr:SH3 domain-containing protein [Anaerolineae bacterium]